MARDGSPRRRGIKRARRASAYREADRNPAFGSELSLEALVEHRRLQVIRNPTAERWRKLREAEEELRRAGEGSAAAAG